MNKVSFKKENDMNLEKVLEKNLAAQQVTKDPQFKSKTRIRRHFRDDYKKKIVEDVLSGKVHLDDVRDPSGNKITKYLVQRWKAEFRGQKFMVEALAEPTYSGRGTVDIQREDMVQELIRLRSENNKLKTLIAIDLGISNDSSPFSSSKAFTRR